MWKYISGVSKVVEEKKKEKGAKAAFDQSKEYVFMRSQGPGSFQRNGKWLWLKNDEEKGMICE